jgi:hypothetical protein
MKHLLKVLEPL